MPLQKAEVSLNLSGKLDTKSDPKLVPESSVLASENIEYSKTGALKKVGGLTQESQVVVRNSGESETTLTLQKPTGFVSDFDKNVLLKAPSEKGLLVFSETEDKWISTNFVTTNGNDVIPQINPPNYFEKKIDAGDGFGFRNEDICYSSKYDFYVMCAVMNNSLYIYRLDSNKNVVASLKSANINVSTARIFIDDSSNNVNNVVFNLFLYSETSQIIYKGDVNYKLETLNSSEVLTPFGLTSYRNFVVKENPYNNQVYICQYLPAIANKWLITRYQKSGTANGYTSVSNTSLATTANLVSDGIQKIDMTFTQSLVVLVFHGQVGVDVPLCALYVNFALNSASDSIYNLAIGGADLVCAYDKATTNDVIIYRASSTGAATYDVYRFDTSANSFLLITLISINNMTINSYLCNAVINGKSKFFMVGSIPPKLVPLTVTTASIIGETNKYLIQFERQSNGYIYLSDVGIIARYSIDKAFYNFNDIKNTENLIFYNNKLINANIYFSKKFEAPYTGNYDGYKDKTYGLKLSEFDFNESIIKTSQKLGKNIIISGAIPTIFDGKNYTIQGFTETPRISTINKINNVNGLFDIGTYQVKIIAEYPYSNGEVEFSKPSAQYEVQFVAKGDMEIILYPCTNLTEKRNSNIKVYITDNAGTIYRLYGTFSNKWNVGGTILLSKALNYYNFPYTPIYTQSGELENDSLPPSKYLLAAKDRIFSICADDENGIYYSKVYLPDTSINFSAFLYKRVEAENGILSEDFKSLSVLDEKIIMFKENSIYAFQGDGPTNSGTNDSFSIPYKVTAEVGCSEPKSLVSTPLGLMFKTYKGIYLLDRGLNISYIGQDVEAYNSSTVVSSILHQNKNVVIFMFASTHAIAFDYQNAKWSTYLGYNGSDLAIYRNVLYTLKNYLVYSQSSTDFRVNSLNNPMKVITPWLKVSGIENFGRVYRAMILGKFKSAHSLIVKTYYDYDETLFETFTINPLVTDDIYQYQINLSKQKCQSLKFEIYDSSTAGSYEGLELSDMSLIIGKKKGLNKISDSKAYQGV